MGPKNAEYSRTVMAGFLAIAVFSFCCGSRLLGLTLLFITTLHFVDVRRKRRKQQEAVDTASRIATLLASRRSRQ